VNKEFTNETERKIECSQGRRDAMRFKVVLEPSDEGGYTVYVPSLPGCISEGETVEEALRNIREAIELYLEPVEDDLVTESTALVQEIEL
jgi:predicted RNase H-like HicB family nuclease